MSPRSGVRSPRPARQSDRGAAGRLRFRHAGTTPALTGIVDDATGTVLRHVVPAPDGTVLADRSGAGTDPRTYGTNGHHDVTWVADNNGAVIATARSDPWGTLLRSSGTLPAWRFQGSWHDPVTDLAYARARWYSGALGSFISEDTLLGAPETPASRHLLAYAQGDPVNGWDPEGREYRTVYIKERTNVGQYPAVRSYTLPRQYFDVWQWFGAQRVGLATGRGSFGISSTLWPLNRSVCTYRSIQTYYSYEVRPLAGPSVTFAFTVRWTFSSGKYFTRGTTLRSQGVLRQTGLTAPDVVRILDTKDPYLSIRRIDATLSATVLPWNTGPLGAYVLHIAAIVRQSNSRIL